MSLQNIVEESQAAITTTSDPNELKLLVKIAIYRGYVAGLDAERNQTSRTNDAIAMIRAFADAIDEEAES